MTKGTASQVYNEINATKVEVGTMNCLLLLAVLAHVRMTSDVAIVCRMLTKMELPFSVDMTDEGSKCYCRPTRATRTGGRC